MATRGSGHLRVWLCSRAWDNASLPIHSLHLSLAALELPYCLRVERGCKTKWAPLHRRDRGLKAHWGRFSPVGSRSQQIRSFSPSPECSSSCGHSEEDPTRSGHQLSWIMKVLCFCSPFPSLPCSPFLLTPTPLAGLHHFQGWERTVLLNKEWCGRFGLGICFGNPRLSVLTIPASGGNPRVLSQ